FYMQKTHKPFTTRVFAALGLGIAFGIFMQYVTEEALSATMVWVFAVAYIYVRLLWMMVIPLVMVSVISAFVKMDVSAKFGKITGRVLLVLVGTAMIAALVGGLTSATFGLNANLITPGEEEISNGESLVEQLSNVDGVEALLNQIVEIVPANVFEDMTGSRSASTISVVFFSALIGLSVIGIREKYPESAAAFTKGVEVVKDVVMRLVTIVLRFTPYGILALITNFIANSNWAAIQNLILFVLATYVALIAMFLIHLIILASRGINPITYVRKAWPVFVFAFSSRTSMGALPLNVDTQVNKMGVSGGIANMSASFGLSIGQNGCAGVYPAMLAVMIAPAVGLNPLAPGFLIPLIIVVAISSFGIAGVGGGATNAALVVLSVMGLPVELVGLMISVEPLMDMGRTALNVSGSMVAGLVTAKSVDELDTDIYNQPSTQVYAEQAI
ncbi:MAG: cation:dicarboxylase symporter family transporter, partial [Anaerolineales bacterium]